MLYSTLLDAHWGQVRAQRGRREMGRGTVLWRGAGFKVLKVILKVHQSNQVGDSETGDGWRAGEWLSGKVPLESSGE